MEISKLLLNSTEYDIPLIKKVQSSENDTKYLIALQSVTINGNRYILSMVASLQSVEEAMGTLKEISWLAYIVAILFSLILSAVIANLIARPLIREIERKKELDDMRRDFIANASHEMKTPISLISLYAESMIDGMLSPEERIECENAIYDETQKMGKLVRDMLEITLLQNEKYKPEISETRLDELISKTINRLDKPIKQKDLVIDIDHLASTTI